MTIINDNDFNEISFILKRNMNNKIIILNNNNLNGNILNNNRIINKNTFKYFDTLFI